MLEIFGNAEHASAAVIVLTMSMLLLLTKSDSCISVYFPGILTGYTQGRSQGGRAPTPRKLSAPSITGSGTVGLTHSDPVGE